MTKCAGCSTGYKVTPEGLCAMNCRVVYCTLCYADDNTKCATCGYGYSRNSQYLCVKKWNTSAASVPGSLWIAAAAMAASVVAMVL